MYTQTVTKLVWDAVPPITDLLTLIMKGHIFVDCRLCRCTKLVGENFVTRKVPFSGKIGHKPYFVAKWCMIQGF